MWYLSEIGTKVFFENEEDFIAFNLDEYKNKITKSFIEIAESKMDAFTANYPSSERFTWGSQYQEALRFFMDKNASTPFTDAVIARTGDSKESQITTVDERGFAYMTAVGDMTGVRIKGERLIEACNSVDELKDLFENYLSNFEVPE